MEFHEKLQQLRKQKGLTQEELATKLGYKSKSAINKIELGINDISQSKVVRFAEALDTTPADLMGWTYEQEPEDLADLTAAILQDPQLLAMIGKYRKLAVSDQKAVQAMVDALSTKNA